MKADPCPKTEALSQFASGEPEPRIEAHIAHCATCRGIVDDWAKIKHTAQSLPWSSPPEHRLHELEEDLIHRVHNHTRSTPRWMAMLGSAAAAALITFFITKGTQRPVPQNPSSISPPVVSTVVPKKAAPTAPKSEVRIQPDTTAQYQRITKNQGKFASEDTIILSEGLLDIEVPPLDLAKPIRVVAGEVSPVEIRPEAGAVFSVGVRDHRPFTVHVLTGRVTIHPSNRPPTPLDGGQTWHPDTSTTEAQEFAFMTAWNAFEAKDYPTAITHFDRAIVAAPEGELVEDARYWRAMASLQAKDYDAATEAFEQFIEAHSSSHHLGQVHLALGGLYYQNNDREAARRQFKAAFTSADAEASQTAARILDSFR